jgi:hypothetical protein
MEMDNSQSTPEQDLSSTAVEAEETVATEVEEAPVPGKSKEMDLNKLKAMSKDADTVADKKTNPYAPNYKFKAADKEMEFDDVVKGIIKTADQEKKLRELYEKAHGIDQVKSERERIRGEYRATQEKYNNLNKGIENLSAMLNKGDYHGFFQALKIPEETILQYALQRVNYREMPPEQRQTIDAQYERDQKLAYLEQSNNELLNMYQQQSVQQRSNELDGYIQRPDVVSIAQSFDARAGKPGAFRDEVIKRGQYYASIGGEDISVEQAVREVAQLVGYQQQQAANEMATAQTGLPPQSTATYKPVIPNIKGRSSSPAKKVISSMEELKKLSASFEG